MSVIRRHRDQDTPAQRAIDPLFDRRGPVSVLCPRRRGESLVEHRGRRQSNSTMPMHHLAGDTVRSFHAFAHFMFEGRNGGH